MTAPSGCRIFGGRRAGPAWLVVVALLACERPPQAWLAALDSPDALRRRLAVVALATSDAAPDTAVAVALVQRLGDDDEDVRRAAADWLDTLDVRSVPVLLGARRSAGPAGIPSIDETLARFGPALVPALEEHLLGTSDRAEQRAALGLLRGRGPAADALLMQALASDDVELAAAAAHALGGSSRPGDAVFTALVGAARASDPTLRRAALAAWVDAAVTRRLSSEPPARQTVVDQLRPLGAGALLVLAQMLASDAEERRAEARELLVALGPASVRVVVATHPDKTLPLTVERLREDVAAFGADAAPELLAMLGDDDEPARAAAAAALGGFPEPLDDAGREALMAALVQPHDLLRVVAADALLRRAADDPDVLGTLVVLCRNDNAGVRGALLPLLGKELLSRLGRRGPEQDSAVELFVELGRDSVPILVRGLQSTAPSVCHGSARALAELGPVAVEALPALREAASGSDGQLADLALRALERIGPP